ncbi:SAUR family protein [Senna tora]|uniref:SAUR family protein n=1 Tax=Senna tora TaxID=362788 RepID=A0A835CAR5_9FABA|nr:SAUR family protein [Senna tora]
MEELGRKGYVPVRVGKEEGEMEKIWVAIKVIHHPTIVHLLDQSADEYGYHTGLLTISCHPQTFKNLLYKISKK